VLILFLFVSRFFCLLILSSWPVTAASCVLLWFVRSLPRSVGSVPTSSVSDVQNLRRPVAVAVGTAKQRSFWSSGGLWVRPARLGLSPTPRAAAHFACDESSRYSAVIGLCRTFAETSGRHCRVSWHFC